MEINKINFENKIKENLINEYKNEIDSLNDNISKKEEIFNTIEKEKNKIKEEIENKENYINQLKESIKKYDKNCKNEIKNKNEINKILKENHDQLNNELNKVNSLRIEDINTINNLKKNIQTLNEENNKIKSQNLELIEKIKTNENKHNNSYNEMKKENDNLNKTNSQLNEYITQLNEQLNTLNLKIQENKSLLKEKELEINNLKEVSKALIDKQKNDLEQKDKNERISPDTHFIICKKQYNKLIWYLVSKINPNDEKASKEKKNNYNDYKWVTELVIPKNQIYKYNKFYDDENIIINKNINNNSYIQKLNKQLEEKEEELNKLNYKNKKLNERIQNKSSNIKKSENLLFGKSSENNVKINLNKSNSNKNVIKTENNINSDNNSIIDKIINYYDNRELSYKNEISKLETKIRNTEDFQSKVNNINGISLQNESDFIEFDDTGGENIIKYLKDKNILKKKENEDDEDILKDIPGNESDYDEIKGLKILTQYLKKDNKEKDKKINNLAEKIKELINNLKYDNKLVPQLSQILELLGLSSENNLNNDKGFFSIK